MAGFLGAGELHRFCTFGVVGSYYLSLLHAHCRLVANHVMEIVQRVSLRHCHSARSKINWCVKSLNGKQLSTAARGHESRLRCSLCQRQLDPRKTTRKTHGVRHHQMIPHAKKSSACLLAYHPASLYVYIVSSALLTLPERSHAIAILIIRRCLVSLCCYSDACNLHNTIHLHLVDTCRSCLRHIG